MPAIARWAFLLIALSVRVANAQPSPDPPPTVKIAGYIETFYQFNFNQPSNLITAYRDFDNRSNSFTIDNAVVDVSGQVGAVSTRIVLQVGHTPASSYLAEPSYPRKQAPVRRAPRCGA